MLQIVDVNQVKSIYICYLCYLCYGVYTYLLGSSAFILAFVEHTGEQRLQPGTAYIDKN